MPAITPDLRERARGCLLGAAVGDAFGMALEGVPVQPVNAQVRELRRGRLAEGHFTEHTTSLLAVAEGLLEPEPLAVEELAARVQALRRPERGQPNRQAFGLLGNLLRREPRPGEGDDGIAAPPLPEAGVLARCLPIALVSLDNQFSCLAQAQELCQASHPHPECVQGSAFVSIVLWHLILGVAPRQAVSQGLEACRELPPLLEETIRWASTRQRDRLGNDGDVQGVLERAVWGLLTTASFAEAVTRVANLGGSAAIAGTIVGAWAGAAYRHSGIPADWRSAVHGTYPPRSGQLWREKDLAQLAESLVLA